MSAVAPRLKLLLLVAATACVALAHADPSQKKGPVAYRWTDEQGVVHYGDNIPPQYASQAHAALDSQGVEVGHGDAQKTPEQQAADARARDAVMKQKQHDAFLLTTYTSVKDIEALRDVRVDQLRGQVAATAQYADSLRSRLSGLQASALNFRPYSARPDARNMPDDLAENLVRTVNELRQEDSALATKSVEESTLRAQFQADIERYRELHTIHTQ
jgi:hypothetical protein